MTDSAIMRVSSCTRVKRSNSSGSKPESVSLACAMRDCICDSACTSTSRSRLRKRSRLADMSLIDERMLDRRMSRRERAISTSPASLTNRSSSWERTRTDCPAATRTGAIRNTSGLWCTPWPASADGSLATASDSSSCGAGALATTSATTALMSEAGAACCGKVPSAST
ncbi:hypothetical protein D3C72_1830610 [compost metagenome]